MQSALKTDYKQHAEALAAALEQQQVAVQAAERWQAELDKAENIYTRRYFKGKVELENLRAFHYNLVARSSQRSGHQPASDLFASGERANAVAREPVIRAKSSMEILQASKGRDKALTERDGHRSKAAALAMLGDRCRELGMESQACAYEARAHLEGAAVRGFNNVIKGYDRRLEDLGAPAVTREAPPNLQSSFERLDRGERNLEEYNSARATVMVHVRHGLEVEAAIRNLEAESAHLQLKGAGKSQFEEALYERDMAAALAEKAAVAAIVSYENFQKEAQSAQKDFEALSRALSVASPEPTETSLSKDDLEISERSMISQETKGDIEGPGRIVTEKRVSDTIVKEPAPHEPELQPGKSDPSRRSVSEQRHHRVVVGAVVGEILHELDREI